MDASVRGRSVIGVREVILGISLSVQAVKKSFSAWIALKNGLLDLFFLKLSIIEPVYTCILFLQ